MRPLHSATRCQPSRVWIAVLLALVTLSPSAMAERAAVLDKPAPQNIEDLREIERRVEAVVERCGPATVSLQVGRAEFGSGVIVSADGIILSAAHVIGEPGRLIQVNLPDGRTATATTLGSDARMDGGMAKLDGEGPWPHVNLAEADALRNGDWVVALGHPGGYEAQRPTVVRLGRAIRLRSFGIQSDCSLIGGDSGGPLFDLEGNLVGIHSRIGESLRSNFHVPVAFYREAWDRLLQPQRESPFMGVALDSDSGGGPGGGGVRIAMVVEDSAAAHAGLRVDDVIESVDGQPATDPDTFSGMIAARKPGDVVRLRVIRDDEPMDVEVTLGEVVIP